MTVKELLDKGKVIWGESDGKITLSYVIVRMGKVFGDICRWERNAPKDAKVHTDDDLMKELGNIIFSTIRWCDDLGYDPEDCIKLAIECQKKGKNSLI